MRKEWFVLFVILSLLPFNAFSDTTIFDKVADTDKLSELSAEDRNKSANYKGVLYIVTAENKLNVRSGAYSNAPIMGQLTSGDSIMVYNSKNGWAVIKYNSGIGFVSLSYLMPCFKGDNEQNDTLLLEDGEILELEDEEILLEDEEAEEEESEMIKNHRTTH